MFLAYQPLFLLYVAIFGLSASGIAMMMVIESLVTGVPQWPPIILFAVVSLVSLVLAARIYGSIRPVPLTAGQSGLTGPDRSIAHGPVRA